ncbi:sulfatase [Rubinisphaera italica]|uniref:Choline-sulfatase n=1 Tax=Rubinisphaera italica TaxID=2527969 RepID=A0A5C5XEE0_9PLAN|nr:sulfatase [Rubinisphaera italica]TWT61168.1 Choline-sulfatase [Rubinisphaera italica]
MHSTLHKIMYANSLKILSISMSLVVAVIFLITPMQVISSEGGNQYNVLFIAIDDLRPELGCYGVENAQSPHLDQFASTGLLFDRHYVQVATCGASRYALLTGRSPASSGVTRSNSAAYAGPTAFKQKQQAGAQTLPELFRRSGYQTCCIGKISHTADGRVFEYNGKGDGRDELPNAWDELATPFGPWKRGWGIFFAYANGRNRESGQGDKDLMEFIVENDNDLPDGLMAQTASEKLKEYASQERPFFLGLGFFKPHLPFVATKQDWDAFAETDFKTEGYDKTDSRYWHKSGEFYKYNAPFEKTQPLSPEAIGTSRRAYYACVRYVDRQVGRVLKTLEESGLADNTIVVIWGDHGWHLGEQQIWGKHSPLERANRSVLMMRIPGETSPGKTTQALTETVDLYPTLVDYCQPEFPKTDAPLDGRSLRPIITGEATQVREAALSYWGKAITIRTDQYRMIVESNKQVVNTNRVELYDLSDDLDANKNVADQNPEVVEQLMKYLPE